LRRPKLSTRKFSTWKKKIQKQPAWNICGNGIKHLPKGALNYGTLVDLCKDGLTKYFNGDGKEHGT
jgi:hypothetical protein